MVTLLYKVVRWLEPRFRKIDDTFWKLLWNVFLFGKTEEEARRIFRFEEPGNDMERMALHNLMTRVKYQREPEWLLVTRRPSSGEFRIFLTKAVRLGERFDLRGWRLHRGGPIYPSISEQPSHNIILEEMYGPPIGAT